MSTRPKLICLSWKEHKKVHIASSDYEGIVTVRDVTTRQKWYTKQSSLFVSIQSVIEYEENEKRAWSVDFSHMEPSMLVFGSDDRKGIVVTPFYLKLGHLILWSLIFNPNLGFVQATSISKLAVCHRFSSDTDEDPGSSFISSLLFE
ncbi:COP1, partial, partial [Olea europaea subsp. europaea]